jgi:subtilisin-like proprotein convertase family protein
MSLSVLLKSFSQTAQKSRRRTVNVVAVLTEQCEERRLLSAASNKIASAIPTAPVGGSSSTGQSGATVALTNLPLLNSLPGAPVSVILKVDGYTDNDPGWISFRDSGSGPIVTPAFDLDGDATTFNTEELRQIQEIWYRVAEDFAPFNVNVTTVAPTTLNDLEHVMVVIGGDGAWAPPAGGWGALDGFSTSGANTNYVFSELFFNPHQIASASSHESGHTLGLQHQSTYDANGTKLLEYNTGTANLAPLMGVGYSALRDTWWLGPNSTSSTTIQDDMSRLTGPQNQTLRYRTDDYGNSITLASPLTTTASSNISVSGIIERNNDSDFFQFTTDDGPISFNLEGLNLRRIYSDNNLTFGTNLDAVLRLYNSAGTVVAQSDPSTSLFANLTANVTAGAYYVEVTKTGQYGAVGQYNLTGTINPLETFSLSVNQSSVVENAGNRAAVGTLTRSGFVNLASPIVVSLTSSDVSELTVPATVTIPAGSNSITFPINAVDDQLSDGVQRATITGSSTVGGRLRTSSASLLVQDHETLSLTVSPSTVYENAGTVEVTITRSNVDTFPPNTFSVVNNQLLEHNYLGAFVRTRTIPWPNGVRPAGQNAHDVVVMEDNRIAVYNGNSAAWLSVLTPSSNTWQHISVPELSTETSIVGTGGISSSGNYVFLTDTKESATEDNGIVRVDVNTGVSTRFATKSPGYRMFVKDNDLINEVIQEIDYLTGAVLNTFPMPVIDNSTNTGLAFDGTFLWVLAGSSGNDNIYQMDPDTGAILDTHPLTGNQGWDGLAALNGLLYVLDDFIDDRITVYNPVQRRVVNTLNIGAINDIFISGGLAAITGPDRLYVTSTFGSTMYEINPTSGVVTNEWSHGLGFAAGVATANNQIYVGRFSGFNGQDLRVFDRQGAFQRSVRLTSNGVDALGGDNVLTPVDSPYRFRDVYSGLDDKIYAVDVNGSTVGTYDAATLANTGFITLAAPVNALAAEADGTLWGAAANGVLYHFSATGTILSQLQIATSSLVDIDLNVAGQILLTSSLGRVYQTDTAGATPTSFSAGNSVAFGSFGRHQTLPSGPVLVQLTNSNSSAVRLPTSVVIPVGQRSVTILAEVVDDKVLDGTQVSTITASAVGYTGTQTRTVTVLDLESVGVNILAGSISEAAGVRATQAEIFRTDTDGPFSYVGPRQYLYNNTSQTILDNDKTNSYITVPTQTSRVTDLNVVLSLTHSFLADLDIYLVSPNGTRVELVSDLVSNEQSMTNTVFDNVARTGILTGSSPFSGRFRPEGELEDFNNENPAGVWTLEITDDNRTDFGTLNSWSMSLETIGLSPMTVNLTKTGDVNEINATTTVVIPANQSRVVVPIDAVDDTLLDGTRLAGLRATTTTASGYFSGSDNVNVLDREILQLTVNKSTVPETAGFGAITGTLRRLNTDISSSFTVTLTSSDSSEITVPSTVTIPAGQASVNFPITAVDDSISDGTQTIAVRAVTSQYVVDSNRIIYVTDVEPKLVLTKNSNAPVSEVDGSFLMTVTRQQQTDLSQPVTVNLAVSEFTGLTTPISLPATVTIPAGRASQTFTVMVNDDELLDGVESATVVATSPGIIEGEIEVQITDHETLILERIPGSVLEDAGAAFTKGRIKRSNLDVAFPLVVTLDTLGADGKRDLTEIRVPTTVTIPVGSQFVDFDIDAVNDLSMDGTQSIRITAVAENYFGTSATVRVDDHEPPIVTGPAATVTDPNPIVTWNSIPNATRYEIRLQNLSMGVEQKFQNIPHTSTSFRIAKPLAESLGIGRYRVFVRAYDQLERPGFWSNARDFRMVTAPTIIGPSTTSSLVSGTFPEIVWTPVIDATDYELTVHNLTTGKMNVISQKNLKTTSYRAVEVLGSGTYRATVRASLVVNTPTTVTDFGNFSAALDFTVLASPGVITPVSGGTFDRSPLLSWSPVTGASSYDVIVQNAQTKLSVFRDRSVPGTSIRVPQDLPNANYEVLVRAQSGRFFSNWSAPRFFAVGASPAITSPVTDQKAGAQPKFVWTSISGAERYEVWVLNVDTNAYVIQVSNVTGTTYTSTRNLPLGEYQVTVRAISLLGDVTDWSNPVTFIGGAAPVINSPVNNSTTGARPSIAWSAVSGAATYQVRIVNLANNVSVVFAGNLTGTNFTPTSNLATGRYRIWVRAVSAQGHLSNWSTPVDTRVASAEEKDLFVSPELPVVAALLPDRTREIVFWDASPANQPGSSAMKSANAEVPNVAEHSSAAEDDLEAELIAAATDYVMASWSVSDLMGTNQL